MRLIYTWAFTLAKQLKHSPPTGHVLPPRAGWGGAVTLKVTLSKNRVSRFGVYGVSLLNEGSTNLFVGFSVDVTCVSRTRRVSCLGQGNTGRVTAWCGGVSWVVLMIQLARCVLVWGQVCRAGVGVAAYRRGQSLSALTAKRTFSACLQSLCDALLVFVTVLGITSACSL